MRFALDVIAELPGIAALPGCTAASPDTVNAVLEEAAKFAGDILAPLNPIGDRQPSRLENGVVRTPPGFAPAYRAYVAAGWNGLALPAEEGGHGLPLALGTAALELWTSANLAFALCPTLTISAAELIIKHGSPMQRRLYRDKLVSGEWTGTMNITEPQAGSDVGAIRTRAVKEGDHYRLTGQKIFITYGDHDLAPNIVHMVLARTPDAPPGVKGLSLFVVPKFLVNNDGSLGAPNDIACVKLEEKLGIHASPTCTLAYGDKGGAIGTLIGEEQRGIDYMFLMMNGARLNIGLQGVAIAERAYQQGRDFAHGRVQGRPVTASAAHDNLPILHHPDVRRMLLAMRAKTEASRALLYYAASLIDRARHEPDAAARARCQSRADLLIPVAKAWSTEGGFEVASTNIQIHGGMGYIEETGAAQHLRDARIALIYEGTNGIQANDLLTRKLMRDEGAAMRALAAEMSALDAVLAPQSDEALTTIRLYLRSGLAALSTTSEAIAAIHRAEPARALAGAAPYLRLVGIVTAGWLMAKAALAAKRHLDESQGDLPFYRAKLTTARFFAEHELATASALLPAILGGGTVMEFDVESF
jgi:alkylation response protein AidB-like acyl-CoA dehydrogenase